MAFDSPAAVAAVATGAMASAVRLRKGTRHADFPFAHDAVASAGAAPADRVLALQEKLQDLIRMCCAHECCHSVCSHADFALSRALFCV